MSPNRASKKRNANTAAGEGPSPVYRRPLLKISGEMLAGSRSTGLARKVLRSVAQQVVEVRQAGAEIAVVVGAGNIFRGGRNVLPEIQQTTADDMGMLGTVINALALGEYIRDAGAPATVLSAIEMPKIAERFTTRRARQLLAEGHALILAGGTGNPFFTTDTAAALRAAELGSDVLLKATNVEGVYSADPKKNPKARLYKRLDYQTVLSKNLGVMDAAAIALCRQAQIPVVVFNLSRKGQIARAIQGEPVGTLVGGEHSC